VVAATNRDLAQAIKRGTFREALYYRIRVFPIELPPLRERKEDIPLLIQHFLDKFNRELSKRIRQVSPEALEVLKTYSYPGNIRELQNIIEHAFVCCEDEVIRPQHLPKDIQGQARGTAGETATAGSLRHLEQETILKVLEKNGWRYKTASEQLGISRSTLWRKLRRLKIHPAKNVSV
jgi:transcriptional regulator with PAS, ATPase and Fis domain